MAPDIEGPVLDEARNLMIRLYNKEAISSLNILRQHMFAQNKSELRSLPPTEDAFKQHVLRALYQLRWWKHAHESNPIIPSVTEFGRNVLNNCLVPITTLLPQFPTDIDVPSFCKCKSSKCQSSRCSCVKADVMCTIAFACATSADGCSREQVVEVEESESEQDF
ncbi:metallothionein-like protein 3B [Elysia marginata]|uniref:Metallothionein-like protein 3B n=1 Tax=Elysia marginata TaxID=1093978 RepID=A0AAV4FNG7_9GAST|nr:metallothionein-like protein 3B [Elysia marginata]